MKPAFLKAPPGHTKPFWDATKRRVYLLQRCLDCESFVNFPREACPQCLSQEHEWVEASGNGVVYAASTHHIPFEGKSMDDCPYVVGLIELEEGPRIVANLVGDEADVQPGAQVRLTWIPQDDEYAVPAFEAAVDSTRTT